MENNLEMGRQKGGKRKIVILLAGVAIVGALGAVLVVPVLPSDEMLFIPVDHFIEGSVTTDDFHTRPVSMTFTSQTELLQITAPVKDNHYEIELPSGPQSFEVEVTWNSLPEVFGTCYAGVISYSDSSPPHSSYDFHC